MKNRKKRLIIAILILVIIFGLWFSFYSDRPFETLDIAEIEEISVYAIPPEKEVVLSDSEVASAVSLLQDLKLDGRKLVTFGMGGQTVTFTVEKVDGSTIEVTNAGNVLIIIDGKTYKAEYESAEAINQFANKVLETGF